MLPYRDSKLSKLALGGFFLVVIGYAYFEARGLLYGPMISIPYQTTSMTDSPYVLIQGKADRISTLSVDGQPIQVTEAGAFQEPYVLSPGVNRIVFDAKDKYGNATQKIIEVVYTPSATSSHSSIQSSDAASATTTPVAQAAALSTSSTSTIENAPLAPRR